MAQPYSVESSVRVHDEAIANWLSGLYVDYGIVNGVDRTSFPIITVFEGPDRAFAAIEERLTASGWILSGPTPGETRTTVLETTPVIPLPIASIERMEPVPWPELNNAPKTDPRRFFDTATNTWVTFGCPTMYRCDYNVTFWSLKRYTDNFIREWVYGQLGGIGNKNYETFITVAHNPVIGSLRQPLKLVSSTNLSSLEGDGTRYIRTRFQFSLRMAIFKNLPTDNPGGEYTPNGTGNFTGMHVSQIVNGAGILVNIPGQNNGVTTVTEETVDTIPSGSYTNNLYVTGSDLFAPYVLYGNATAAFVKMFPAQLNDTTASRYCLQSSLNSSSDIIDLTRIPVTLESDSTVTTLVYFWYMSNGPVVLNMSNVDTSSGALTPAMAVTLPSTANVWKRARFYCMSTSTMLSWNIRGSGTQTMFAMCKGDIRQIFRAAVTSAGTMSSVSSLGITTYTWIGLNPSNAYIITVKLSAAPGTDFSYNISNDSSTPTYTKSGVVLGTTSVGMHFLMQPKSTTMTLSLPSTLPIALVGAKLYFTPIYSSDI